MRATGTVFSRWGLRLLKSLLLLGLFWIVPQDSWARGLTGTPVAPGVLQTGVLADPDITESSGLVASRKFPGVFWTHNDHGSKPVLFAVTRNGAALAKFDVTGVTITDWEDITTDSSGNLYIGDIGNNDLSRDQLQIYRALEPSPHGSGSIRTVQIWRIKFPDGNQNCETLFLQNGFAYLVNKFRQNGTVNLYRFPLSSTNRVTTVAKLGSIRVNGDVGGGAISLDGNRLALLSDSGAYGFRINGNPVNITRIRGSFTPFPHPNMEGATFVPDGLLVSAENGDMLLFNGLQFRP